MSDEQNKKKKHRSPNYPFIGLEEAIERAKKLKEVGGYHTVGFKSLMDAWQYKSGTTSSVIAALKAFGLVIVSGEGELRKVILTDEAKKILAEHSDTPELLKIAALSPSLYKELWEKYDGELPPSDKVISEYLEFDRGFNPTVINGLIKDFRATVAFAKLEQSVRIDSGDAADEDSEDNLEDDFEDKPPAKNKAKTRRQSEDNGEVEELSFKLSPDSSVEIIFTSKQKVTQEDIDLLRNMLFLQKFAFPKADEIRQRVEIRYATWKNKDHDQPVMITGELGEKDGKKFYAVEGTNTGISEDELDFGGDN